MVQVLVAIGALWMTHSVHGAGGWVEVLETTSLLLVLAAAAYVAWLQHAMQTEVATRGVSEQELLRERNTLEQRVNERTAELQTEVEERRRTEQLNRGRNQVLEMLARNEPTDKILETLVETVAKHRSTWSCALHLLECETLRLAAQSRLPQTLAGRLDCISTKDSDAPESVVLKGKDIFVLPDLNQEHRPWIELLRANGAQSAWSAPFLGGGKPLGTMTVYTLLLYPPQEADIELLKMSCQMASLVLERQRMHEQLVHRAYHDSLTGLGNRLFGKKGLEAGIQLSRCKDKRMAVFWIDLNKFKQINDTYGHPAGDHVLQEVASRLTAGVRTCDTVARMGGDEFMVVMEGMENRKDAGEVADKLLELLSQPIIMNDLQLNVTASIGISFYPEDGNSADALEQCADQAMYHAKFSGVGVRSFTGELSKRHMEGSMFEAKMKSDSAAQ
jgi:diguanylate cyclase (GGDEF)-like protein